MTLYVKWCGECGEEFSTEVSGEDLVVLEKDHMKENHA